MHNLEIHSLRCSYGYENGEQVSPVKDLSFSLHAGKIHQLKGDNGSGKSTVLNALLGTVPTQDGTFKLQEKEGVESYSKDQVKKLRNGIDSMFYVPQITHTMFPTKTCVSTYLKLMDRKGQGISAAMKKHKIFAELLEEIEWRHTEHISGGQRQLLALLAMYVSDSKLVLLDEPTSDISAKNIGIAINLIKNYVDESKTILIATHCTKLEKVVDDVIQVN